MAHKIALLMVLITTSCWGQGSYEWHIRSYYRDVVKETQDQGLSGPIANEAAQFAFLRRLIEDGLDRSLDVSMNGMVPGSPNKEVMQRLTMPGCKLSRVTANDGQGCYVISGPRANVMGAVAIAFWYDSIINSDQFRVCSTKERELWNRSKWCSHMIAVGNADPKYRLEFQDLRDQRFKIIEKVNSAYGPGGYNIKRLRQQLEKVF